MPAGSRSYDMMAVPLYGEATIQQETAATDILTIDKITGGTGDFLVLRDNSGTELFVIDANGAITASQGLTLAAGDYLNLAVVTTAPTTGLTKGDIFLVWSANTTPVLAACTSTAANTIKYVSPFDTKTLGRTT